MAFRSPLRAGLTGGIGAGKSTVAGMFRALGCPFLDLDVVSREVTRPGQPVLEILARNFGDGIVLPDGGLDRPQLGRIIFADPDARKRLERILHPLIMDAADQWILGQAQRTDSPRVVMLEIPLLFEAGLESTVDRIVLVSADGRIRIARIIADRDMNECEARLRIGAQLPDSVKRPRSHYVINNNGSLGDLNARVGEIWGCLNGAH